MRGLLLTLLVVSTSCTSPQTDLSAPVASRLLSPIVFEHFTVCAIPDTQAAERWKGERLHVGTDNEGAFGFLTLREGDAGRKLRAETCGQYLSFREQGAYALSTADQTVEAWFLRASGALQFLSRAGASTRPLMPSGPMLALLPALLLEDGSGAVEVRRPTLGQPGLEFSTPDRNWWIEELARGDTDGDGLEEALIFVGWHYKEGSGRGYELHRVLGSSPGSIVLGWFDLH